jgi:heme oxygenase
VAGTGAALSARSSALALPERLRAETAHWHHEVEALADIPGRVRSRADYTNLLGGLFELHTGLETQLSDQIWNDAWLGVGVHIATHCRAGLLIADLGELGVNPPTGVAQQSFSCFGEAIGCLYVLEGSAIGGRIVAGMVRSAIGPVPTAFLTGPGRGHQWPVVRSALRRFQAQGGDGDAAVAGASATFAAFARQFAGQQVPQ